MYEQPLSAAHSVTESFWKVPFSLLLPQLQLYGIHIEYLGYQFLQFLVFLLLFLISSYFTFEKDAGWLAKNFPKLLRNCAVIPSGHFYSGKHFLKIEEKKQVRLCWFCLGRIANSQIFYTNHIFRPKSARKLPCSDDYNLSSLLNNLAYRAFKP